METTETTSPVIPSENDAVSTSGSKSWRFANGKIVRGERAEDNSYPEQKTRLVGQFKRCGLIQGEGKYGKVYKLEADFLNSEGETVRIAANLLDDQGAVKVGVSVLNFAWSLLQFAKDEVVMLETALGEPVQLPGGKKGGRPTYVNPSKHIGGSKFQPIYRPRRDPNAPKVSMEDQFNAHLAELKSHPAYEEREFKTHETDDHGSPTELALIDETLAAKGWPLLNDNKGEWLTVLANYFEHPVRDDFATYSEDALNTFRQAIGATPECPVNKPEPKPVKGLGKPKDAFAATV